MRILYTNYHTGYGGGHDTYIKTLLKNTQHTLYVACPQSSSLYKALQREGFENLIAIDFPGRVGQIVGVVKSAMQLIEFIKEYKIDVVHTNGSPDNRIALYARLLGRLSFKMFNTRHHTSPCKGWISQWRYINTNHAIIFVSHVLYQSIGFPVHAKHIYVVPHGIDTHHQWKRDNNKNIKKPIVLASISGTSPSKGCHHLINALKLLPKEIQENFEVIIAGNLPDMPTLSQLCNGDWLPNIVRFTGFLQKPQQALKEADIGFVLSEAEALSFACREMMASALPVIVSDVGGLPENIDNGINGWIIPGGNTQKLASLLKEIHDMPAEELMAMQKNARHKAKSEFDIKQMLDKMNQIYAQYMSC